MLSSSYNLVSLIWGIGWLIVLFIPYIFYFKIFFGKEEQENKKSLFEKILGVVILQFVFAIIYFLFAEILIFAFKVKMFNPCAGLRFFLFGIDNANCNVQVSVRGVTMWNAWIDIIKSLNDTVNNPYEKTSRGLLTAIATISSIFYYLLFVIGITIAFIPLTVFFREMRKNKISNEQVSVTEAIFKAFITMLAIYFLVYFHFSIASRLAMGIANVSGFDAFEWIRIALRELFGINK